MIVEEDKIKEINKLKTIVVLDKLKNRLDYKDLISSQSYDTLLYILDDNNINIYINNQLIKDVFLSDVSMLPYGRNSLYKSKGFSWIGITNEGRKSIYVKQKEDKCTNLHEDFIDTFYDDEDEFFGLDYEELNNIENGFTHLALDVSKSDEFEYDDLDLFLDDDLDLFIEDLNVDVEDILGNNNNTVNITYRDDGSKLDLHLYNDNFINCFNYLKDMLIELFNLSSEEDINNSKDIRELILKYKKY